MYECSICGITKNLQYHHLYSQTKLSKKLYPEFIHDHKNLVIVCADCHMTKPLPKLSEHEFCKIMGIEPRSKSAQIRRMREKN